MTKKEFNIDLDDPRAGKIAEIISNKTAKRILGLLADEELSESEIAEKLRLPSNTVNYNVRKLREAGFIEPVKGFLWSVKGKRIFKYKISNKKVVISPKVNMTRVASLVGVFVLIGLVAIIAWQASVDNSTGIVQSDEVVKQFGSLDEMKNFIEAGSESYDAGFGMYDDGVVRSFAAPSATFAESSAMDSSAVGGAGASKGGAGQASDYSQTNIQVEGVDEPDIVKNDGKYIYAVNGKTVSIIDAYPAENMEIVSKIEMTDYVNNIFVSGDKLVVFSNRYVRSSTGIACGDFYVPGLRCGEYTRNFVAISVYDISDRVNPIVDEEFESEGYYSDARMIGGKVYLISTKYIDLGFIELPTYRLGGVEKSVALNDLYYIDSADGNYVFSVISAIDVDDGEMNTEAFLTGGSSYIYVSENNIYLTTVKQISRETQYELFAEKVLYDVFPNGVVREMQEVMDSDISLSKKQTEISEIAEDYIDGLDKEELVTFLEKYEASYHDFAEELGREQEKTVVTRIAIDGMDVALEAVGEVPGYILDQFSMDETNGYFRVATTTGNTWDSSSENNLYVLNDELEIVGELEGLAEGEKIYSARFMGDRAYLVTFKQVDPLFAIDLSDARNPEVLGYLKVTGYSDYLQPYDENHLIGIGKEADAGGRTTGIKISLFDVSDVTAPKESAKYEITDGDWSDSEALYEHKAVLFDKEKNLLVIPVSYNERTGESYGYKYWQGAFVFHIDEASIRFDAKIAHDMNSSGDAYWYGGDYVRRALYMDDTLYTISTKFVKANSLSDFSEIGFVELPHEDYVYYGGFVEKDIAVG